MEAAAMPFPRPERTPPVTMMYLTAIVRVLLPQIYNILYTAFLKTQHIVLAVTPADLIIEPSIGFL